MLLTFKKIYVWNLEYQLEKCCHGMFNFAFMKVKKKKKGPKCLLE